MASEFNLACSLANPFIRQEVRGLCGKVHWSSELARSVVAYFLTSTQVIPNSAEIRQHFSTSSHIEEEVEKIVRVCDEFKNPAFMSSRSAINNAIEEFVKYCRWKIVAQAAGDYQKGSFDAESVINKIKSIGERQTSKIPLTSMHDLEVDDVISREIGDSNRQAFPSILSPVRESTPYGGYQRGEVVEFCGPPSSGKSLLMLNEVIGILKAGAFVYWLALGDMGVLDLVVRASCIITGEAHFKVLQNPKKYYLSGEVQPILKGLKVSTVAAGEVDINAVYEFVETRVSNGKMLDMFVLDYDANLQRVNPNMYEDAEITFNNLNRISRPEDKPFRLVFVGSQPKAAYWNQEELPKESVAESSRKQAIVDKLVTLGRAQSMMHHCGMIKLAKCRRGKEGATMRYKVSECGKFEEVGEGEYPMMKTTSSNDYFPKGKKKFNGGGYNGDGGW